MTNGVLERPRVAPSILSADFARLGEQVAEVLDAGARVIHVDVMDGHFVPAMSMGPQVVSALRERTTNAGAILDVHLMIERPERHVAEFARAGADLITIHTEATPHAHYAVCAVRETGVAAGVAICPGTPVAAVSELARDVDLVLCMTVDPGWGGQSFIEGSLGKIERLRGLLGPGVALAVDGGIDARTAGPCAASGAGVFVAGSAIFSEDDPGTAYAAIAASAGAS